MKPGFKAKESDNHFILHHPDGDFIKVAKKGLSPESMMQIQQMACGGEVKGFADGGKATVGQLVQNQQGFVPDMPQMPQSMPAQVEAPPLQESKPTYGPASVAYAHPAQTNPTSIVSPAADALDTQVKDLTGARDKWMNSVQGEAATLGKQSQDEVAIRGREIDRADAIQNEFKFETDRLNGQIKHTIDSINSKQIDPMKAWHEKGTGSKIASLIGIILGGVGGAMTGQGNPAMKVLQQQIDNDIKAQEAELGKKQTLLGHYMQQYNNLGMARQAATANLTAMVGAQLAMNSARHGQTLAGLRGQAAAQQLFMQTDAMIRPLATQAAMIRQSGKEGTSDDPMQQLRTLKALGQVTPEEEKAIIKESADAKETLAKHSGVDSVLDRLEKEQTVANRVFSPLQSRAKIKALKAELIPFIQSADATKRLSDTVLAEKIDPFVTELVENRGTKEANREGLHNIVEAFKPSAGTMEYKRLTVPQYIKTGKAPAMTPGLKVGKR